MLDDLAPGNPWMKAAPAILVFCCIGSYSVNNSVVDVALMAGFGLFGYGVRKLDCEPAPLALGFVLGRHVLHLGEHIHDGLCRISQAPLIRG